MPTIILFSQVIAQAESQGFISLYPSSGAFGYAKGTPTHAVGWVADEDSTIRPEARALTIAVPHPAPKTLATLAATAWAELLSPSSAWVTPKAHWAYELDFGSAAWMPDLLKDIGVDPDSLESRHDGTALAFEPGEAEPFRALIEGLLTNLLGSDFQIMFPGRDLVCSVHHHKQLWWTSKDESLIERLRGWPASMR